jgi:hypothetical protein
MGGNPSPSKLWRKGKTHRDGDAFEVQRALVAPQGFEPRLIGSEPTVLPLNERAKRVGNWQPQARREPQSAAFVSLRGEGVWVNLRTGGIDLEEGRG